MEQVETKKPLVSVILPVYNGEKTVQRCADSILAQDFADFELLIVDDGSKDGTLDLLNRVYSEEKRVRIIHKANGGVSSARNKGLDCASGEWITFVDCDDYVDSNYLSSFMAIEALREDTLYVNGRREGFTPQTLREQKDLFSSGDMSGKPLAQIADNGTVWGKLFFRRIIEAFGIRFNKDVFYGEDKLFTLRYCAHANRIIYNSNAYVYNYVNDFNPFKFIKPFDKQLLNYTEIAYGVCKEFSERFENEWLVKQIYLLLFSLYITEREGKERRKKIDYIKQEIPTVMEGLRILAHQNWKKKLIFASFTKESYRMADFVLWFAVPIAAKLFTNPRTPLWIKSFLKSIF